MKQVTNIDGRKQAARQARNYIEHSADMFALPFTAGSRTIYRIYKAETLLELFRNKAARVAFKLDGETVKWKGLQITHVPAAFNGRHIAQFAISKAYKDIEQGSNGTRSDALENYVCAALNQMGGSWKVTAHEFKTDYMPDVTSSEGITVEVKGLNGRLF